MTGILRKDDLKFSLLQRDGARTPKAVWGIFLRLHVEMTVDVGARDALPLRYELI
jgi:hypothetical protein